MRKRLLQNLGVSLFALLFSALLAEVALRLVLPPPRVFKHPQETYEFDDQIGHRLTPGQESWTHDEPVFVNSMGVRGPEYGEAPPPGKVRVLAIGDSQTFGNGVPLGDTWPGRLESVGMDRAQPLEVINGGIPATDTWQHDLWARRLAEHYDPDVIVLAFYVNDVRRPFVPKEEAVIATNSGVQRLKYLLKRSAIVATTQSAVRGYQARKAMGTSPQWEQRVVQGLTTPAVEEAWKQVETSLGSIRDWSGALGMDFLVIVLPHRAQVNGSMDGTAYNQKLEEIAGRLDIPLVDLLPVLTEAYRTHGSDLFIPWDGHNSAVANGIIAEATYERVVDLLAARDTTP